MIEPRSWHGPHVHLDHSQGLCAMAFRLRCGATGKQSLGPEVLHLNLESPKKASSHSLLSVTSSWMLGQARYSTANLPVTQQVTEYRQAPRKGPSRDLRGYWVNMPRRETLAQVKLALHNAYRDIHFWKLSNGADFEKEAFGLRLPHSGRQLGKRKLAAAVSQRQLGKKAGAAADAHCPSDPSTH